MKSRRKSPVNTMTTQPQHCSIDLRLRILGRLPFFAGLSAQALEQVNQRFVERGRSAGEIIYASGDAADRLFVVAEGKVKLLQHTEAGRSVLLELLTSGEFFGNLATLGVSTYPDTAQAQSPACVLSIRSDDFRQVLDEHPQLALKTMAVMAERLASANQRLLRLSSMAVDQRIAYTLLDLGRKHGREQDPGLLIDVPLSRDDLAQMTGATTETVSRVMSLLQGQGVIESGRQWVAITNPQQLEALARQE